MLFFNLFVIKLYPLFVIVSTISGNLSTNNSTDN